MRLVGLVLARGGSSLPNKNLRRLRGVPILLWTLVPACRVCDLVILVSDDQQILDAAIPFLFEKKIRLHHEPPLLASGRVGDLPVIRDALRDAPIEATDVLLLLRPTAPFRRDEEIRAVAELLVVSQADSVRSVVPAGTHPQKSYLQTGLIGNPQKPGFIPASLPPGQWPYLTPAVPDRHRANHPRQWLQPAWRACGFVDAVRADTLIGMDSMEGDIIVGWPAPSDRAVDIDDEDQWQAAEALASALGWMPGEIRGLG